MSEIGHNSTATQAELRSFVERVERLQDEKKIQAREYSDMIKEVLTEAKGRGYDTAAIKEIIRTRSMTSERRESIAFYSDVLEVFT